MQLPTKFGRYELEELLGGGMAKVYRARDTVIDRTVAVKILTESATADPDSKARFLREAKTAGQIVHENIIRIYDFGEHEGRPYMVMEFLRGEDLRQAIQNQHTGDLLNRMRIALGLLRALEHIHSLGIVHRDIKPENVHIDQTGKVRLVDFGIAKSADFNLTRPGYTLGTPSYMAPEQVRGQQITPLVDVYAFGILLFELLSGVKPIQGNSFDQIFRKILTEPVDLTPLEQGSVPALLIDLVRRMLAKDPPERPQSLQEVRQAMEPLVDSMEQVRRTAGPIPTLSQGGTKHTARWTAASLAGAVAAMLLLVVLIVYLAGRPTRSHRGEQSEITTAPAGMVLIPAGPFPFGPASKTVGLPAFYIDKTEVSNAEYEKFARATGRKLPVGAPNEPVVSITVDDAQAYSAWARKRLPTSQEWEKAARGPTGMLYPWGNQPDPRNANVKDNPALTRHGRLPVDSLTEGASPYGILHLAGNVSEFVFEFAAPGPEQVKSFAKLLSPAPVASESWCVVRGGSFDKPLPKNVNVESTLVPARYASETIGFRCVKGAR